MVPLLIVFLVLIYLLSKLVFRNLSEESLKIKRLNVLSIIISVVIFFGLLLWVVLTFIEPYWDQNEVYITAQKFINKDYSPMSDTYLTMYPQQYGLIFYESFFLRIWNHYGIFQILNALFISLTVFFSTKLALEISDSAEIGFFTLILTATCFPLHYYVSFVYGDVFLVFSGIIVSYLAVRWIKTAKKRFFLLSLIVATIMVPVRQNSLIFLIALVIFLILQGMKNKKLAIVLLSPLFIIVPLLSDAGIKHYYEKTSGIEISHNEIPSINWIAMGLYGDPYLNEGVGYFNGYNQIAWSMCGNSKEASAEYSKELLGEMIQEFIDNPTRTYHFFRMKAYEQWIDPFFDSIQMTAGVAEYSDIRILYNSVVLTCVRFYMNIFLSFVYLFAFIYMLYSLKHEKDFYGLILAVAFIGGFLFSLFWEAKGRYTFPFFVYLLPLAGVGIRKTLDGLKTVSSFIKEKNAKETDMSA